MLLAARDKTALDAHLLESVLKITLPFRGKLSAATAENFRVFDKAVAKQVVVGKVDDRIVRAAFSAAESIVPQMAMDKIPNPFVAPHNLGWYFGNCICPKEVRVFATRLGGQHIRVWSVAQDRDYWRIVAQVFLADSIGEAKLNAEQNSRVPSKSLKNHMFEAVDGYSVTQAELAQAKEGHFVEVLLRKKGGS